MLTSSYTQAHSTLLSDVTTRHGEKILAILEKLWVERNWRGFRSLHQLKESSENIDLCTLPYRISKIGVFHFENELCLRSNSLRYSPSLTINPFTDMLMGTCPELQSGLLGMWLYGKKGCPAFENFSFWTEPIWQASPESIPCVAGFRC